MLVFGAGPSGTPLPSAELVRCLAVARKAGASDLAVELPENAPLDAAAEAVRGFEGARLLLVGAAPELRERLGTRVAKRAT